MKYTVEVKHKRKLIPNGLEIGLKKGTNFNFHVVLLFGTLGWSTVGDYKANRQYKNINESIIYLLILTYIKIVIPIIAITARCSFRWQLPLLILIC